MIRNNIECKYTEICKAYDATDALCINGNAPHKVFQKPICYTSKKECFAGKITKGLMKLCESTTCGALED